MDVTEIIGFIKSPIISFVKERILDTLNLNRNSLKNMFDSLDLYRKAMTIPKHFNIFIIKGYSTVETFVKYNCKRSLFE